MAQAINIGDYVPEVDWTIDTCWCGTDLLEKLWQDKVQHGRDLLAADGWQSEGQQLSLPGLSIFFPAMVCRSTMCTSWSEKRFINLGGDSAQRFSASCLIRLLT